MHWLAALAVLLLGLTAVWGYSTLPGNTDLYLCYAWLPDCSVMWSAVAGIGSLLAALATAGAAFAAAGAAKVALEIEASSIRRDKDRQVREAIPIARAIQKEVTMASAMAVIVSIYFIAPGATKQRDIDENVIKWRHALRMSFTASVLDRLGCLDAALSSAIVVATIEGQRLEQELSFIKLQPMPRVAGSELNEEQLRFKFFQIEAAEYARTLEELSVSLKEFLDSSGSG